MDPNTPDKFPHTIHIGVVGEPSTGKGSLISALLELKREDERAAPISASNEDMEQTNRYPHPLHDSHGFM